jgi:alkanesulfonate monooxygenase SsuD/methylene tetrahydromethanopterin reductase-like flavin-dependent oxidoreductase (luciferase family)
MKFGIFDIMQVQPEMPSYKAYQQHLEDAVLADELGLDLLFVAERHFMKFYRTPSPTTWLAAVAARTKRIRIGALGYTLPLHHPVRLAEEISMLDHLSMGRMEIGVGLGHRVEELVSLGVDPAVRQPMMIEALVLMQRAWEGQTFNFPGKAFKARDVYVEAPIQLPHPPLWYAGNDPQAATWAARNTCSLAIGFQPDDQLVNPATAFNEEKLKSRKPGERPFLGLMRHLYVAESDDQARDEMIEDIRHLGEAFAASPRQLAGWRPPDELSHDEAAEQVERMQAQNIIISGSPETCASTLVDVSKRLGLNVFLANPYLTGVEQERVQRTIRLYAEQVVPAVRSAIESGNQPGE